MGIHEQQTELSFSTIGTQIVLLLGLFVLLTLLIPSVLNALKEDIQQWRNFQQGDQEAYTALYMAHIRAMYRYGISLVPVSEAFVLDCIHDVFTEIWTKRNRLSEPENVRFYLLKALKVRILHLLQRQERPHQSLSDSDLPELWGAPSAEEIYAEVEQAESREKLMQKLMSQLPPRQREVLTLRFVEEMDYNQIADVLSINHQSAKNLVFRAIEKLREWIPSAFLIISICFFL